MFKSFINNLLWSPVKTEANGYTRETDVGYTIGAITGDLVTAVAGMAIPNFKFTKKSKGSTKKESLKEVK